MDTSGFENLSICGDDGASQCYSTDTTLDGETQQIGVYCNWYTLTAGTGIIYGSTTRPTVSICPKNWQLPRGNHTSSTLLTYRNITTVYGITIDYEDVSEDTRKFPFSFIRGGRYNTDTAAPIRQLTTGYYATRDQTTESGDAEETYYSNPLFRIHEGYTRVTSTRKRIGFTARCAIKGH